MFFTFEFGRSLRILGFQTLETVLRLSFLMVEILESDPMSRFVDA